MTMRLTFAVTAAVMLSVYARSEAAPAPEAPAAEAEAAAAPAEPAEFTSDLVILKSELAVEGKVVRRTRDAVYVLVDYGVLSIPRSKIKSIEVNLAGRIAELPEDDYVGRYRLAVSALEEGNSMQARKVFEELVGKEGVPPEVHKRLAMIYESQGELKKALEHWRTYALARPDDALAKKKIKELEEALGEAAKPDGDNGGAAAKPAIVEGLEGTGKWEILPWGNTATLSTQDLEGNKFLAIDIPGGGGKDKTAIGRNVKLDLSEKSKMTFSAFSAEKGRVEVGVAIVTGASYFESRPVVVRPDWNMGLTVDLVSPKWKCANTKWRFEAALEKPEDVRQIILLVYIGRRKARLYFDSIVFE